MGAVARRTRAFEDRRKNSTARDAAGRSRAEAENAAQTQLKEAEQKATLRRRLLRWHRVGTNQRERIRTFRL